VGLWAAIGLFVLISVTFHWSWAWVIGLGAGISQLAASTPRKKSVPRQQ
jgi:hypothetical protein